MKSSGWLQALAEGPKRSAKTAEALYHLFVLSEVFSTSSSLDYRRWVHPRALVHSMMSLGIRAKATAAAKPALWPAARRSAPNAASLGWPILRRASEDGS